MEVAGIFVALASEGLIVFFLFHFYVNVFSITGKWEKHIINHPRMRGVDDARVPVIKKGSGLSPRVRVRCGINRELVQGLRFIPACAR